MQNIHQNGASDFFCVEVNGGSELYQASKSFSTVEVTFILKGGVEVWVENRSSIRAEAGDIIFIFPNQRCRYAFCESLSFITLRSELIRVSDFLSVLSSYSPESGLIKGGAEDTELLSLARGMLEVYRSEGMKYRDTALKGYMTAILGRLLSTASLKKNELEDTTTASEIIKYCTEHYKEKLSLETLEKALHINKYYISHVINGKIGTSFNGYVNSLRINEATRLLRESDKTVKEISAEVGFGTVRSFDRAFRSVKGETASEYRKKATEK